MTLFGLNLSRSGQVSMKLLKWALVQYKHEIDVLIKTGNLDTDIHMRGIPCEDEVRYWNDTSTSRGALMINSKSPEVEERQEQNSLTALKKNQPYQHFDLGLLASIIVRQ